MTASLVGCLAIMVAACDIDAHDYTSCASNADCPHGTCRSDGHCAQCSAEAGCVPEPSCAAIGCDGGVAPTCKANADCAADQVCVAGSCIAGQPCKENADCAVSDVCLDGLCTFVGACVADFHCGCSAPACVDHQCAGADTCNGGPTHVIPCAISADCPEKFYCIGGACEFATECVQHADCPAAEACFRNACWEL